jgi:peptidoglycan/LPS O-acetylase OafA/YrhL
VIRFRADIEGLRAVAVLLVIFNHLGFRGFRGGFIGVDVFFVISGYLITSLLAAEYEARRAAGPSRGSVSILGFYLRRARRILPAALAVTVAIVVGARLLLNSLRVEQVQHDALWATLFGSNVNFIRQASNYFEAGFATSSPFRHYWSLAVEEQFYFVWPTLFLLIVGRHGLRIGGRRLGWRARLGAGLMAIGIGSFVWSVLDTGTSPASAYFSTFTRAWELALGALIGVATTRATAISSRQALAAAWAGMAFLIAGCIVIDARSAFPGYVALLPTLGAALVIVAGLTETAPLPNKILAVAPTRFVGRISYSLYLWHWPFLVFAAALYPHTSAKLSTRIEILALTFAVSTLSYYLIERPFRKLPVTVVRSRVARSMDWLEGTRLAFGAAVVASAAALGALFVVATHQSSSETHLAEAGGAPAVRSG